MFLRNGSLAEGWAVAVCAHLGLIEIPQKSVGGNLTWGAGVVGADEEVGNGARDGSVLGDFVDDRAGRNPWGDKNGGDADAETVEVEGVGRSCGVGLRDEAVGRAGRRRHVVVGAAMLVIDDQDRGVRPQIRILAYCGVNGGDELFSSADVVVWMLVAGDELSGAVGRVVVCVVRLDEAVRGKLVAAAGVLKILKGAEELRLVLQEIDYFE